MGGPQAHGNSKPVRVDSRSCTEPKTTTHESCLNGGKRVVRAVPNRLDDMIFEFVQHGKLLVQRPYRFWISECVTTAKSAAFHRGIERWPKNDVMKSPSFLNG